jgi:hypothetical protein
LAFADASILDDIHMVADGIDVLIHNHARPRGDECMDADDLAMFGNAPLSPDDVALERVVPSTM